jgi:hypothetical protein
MAVLFTRQRCYATEVYVIRYVLVCNKFGILKQPEEFLLKMNCTKCGGTRFNSWNRRMDCRNERARVRAERIKDNGGTHSSAEWKFLLARSPTCAVCNRTWATVPLRPDPRYKNLGIKGHKTPIYHGAQMKFLTFRQSATNATSAKTPDLSAK